MRKIVLVVELVGIAVLFGLFATPPAAAQGEPCSQCGPGPHWVDICGAGQDQIANQGAVVGIDMDLDCVEDISLVLRPCAVPNDLLIIDRSDPRDDSQNFPGLRPVDGHLDVIDTEIISMCLTGGGITLRAGAGQQQGPGILAPSLGAIAEQPGDPTRAESFFDVFFEVDLGGGMYVYNQTPLRIEVGPEGITCVPPQADYIKPEGCFPLYTSPIPGQGMLVANLVTADHSVNPPLIPTLTEWGLIIFGVLLLGFMTWVFLRRKKVIGARV
jgi:hypothetical protein